MKRSRLLNYSASIAVLLLATWLLLLLPLPWGYSTHIHTSIEISRSPAEVFAYVTTPASWPKWHLSSLAVRGQTDHSLIVGEQVTEDFGVAGREGTAVWTVIDRQPNRRWTIEGNVVGGGKGIVSYTVAESSVGTHFERDFDYSFSRLLLILLDRFEIRSRVGAESTEAVNRLKTALDSDA